MRAPSGLTRHHPPLLLSSLASLAGFGKAQARSLSRFRSRPRWGIPGSHTQCIVAVPRCHRLFIQISFRCHAPRLVCPCGSRARRSSAYQAERKIPPAPERGIGASTRPHASFSGSGSLMRMHRAVSVIAAGLGVAALSPATAASLNDFKQVVVIYEENHSFDNLYSLWGKIEGKSVDGLLNADLPHTTQIRQDNVTPYACLMQ